MLAGPQQQLGGPVVLPKMKGMGDGGQTRMTNVALNQQIDKVLPAVAGIPGF